MDHDDLSLTHADAIYSDQDPATSSLSFMMLVPDLNEHNICQVGRLLDTGHLVSLAFLLITDAHQAHSICLKLENAELVPAGVGYNSGEYFMRSLIRTAKAKGLRKGWHLSLLTALHLIGRFRMYLRPGLKEFSASDAELESRLDTHKFSFLDSDRVTLFQICCQLERNEANDLAAVLTNSPPDVDSVPLVSTVSQQNSSVEVILLQALKSSSADQLISVLKGILPRIVHLSELKFNQLFLPILELKEYSLEKAENILRLRHGDCLIINNRNFQPGPELLSERDGTEYDEAELIKTWTLFGLKVQVKRDLTDAQIRQSLEDFRVRVNTKAKRCGPEFFCVVCILSHGRRNGDHDEVMGINGAGVATDSIINLFADTKRNAEMADKVKVFIVQACRLAQANPNDPSAASPVSGAEQRNSNALVLQATMSHSVAYRRGKEGSLFIQSLCSTLQEHGNTLSLNECQGVANRRMMQLCRQFNVSQCATAHSTLVGLVRLTRATSPADPALQP